MWQGSASVVSWPLLINFYFIIYLFLRTALAHFLLSQTIPTISFHARQEDSAFGGAAERRKGEDSAFGRAAEQRKGTHLSTVAAVPRMMQHEKSRS